MISVGYCIISLASASIFKVIEMDHNKGIYVIPYSRMRKIFLKDNVGLIPTFGVKYYKPIECPRSKHV